jgi:hypothetical protein
MSDQAVTIEIGGPAWHLRMLDSLDRKSIYSKTQHMPRVQQPQAASKRDGLGLGMANTHCFSIWIQRRIPQHPSSRPAQMHYARE